MLSISFYINCFSEVTVQPCLGWKKTNTLLPHIPLAPNVPSPFQGHSSGCSWTPFENNIETPRTPRRWPIWKMCKTCKTMGTMEIRSQPRDDSVWQHDPQPKHHFFCWWKRHRIPHWTTDPVMQSLVWRGNNLKKELDLRKIREDFVWWFLSGHQTNCGMIRCIISAWVLEFKFKDISFSAEDVLFACFNHWSACHCNTTVCLPKLMSKYI